MHGRPFRPFDNRDLWRAPEYHRLLAERFALLGEVYLDICYDDILYITDTGRNWTQDAGNLRDKVESKVGRDFASTKELLAYLGEAPHPRFVFSVHPHRWYPSQSLGWFSSWGEDHAVNGAKAALRLMRGVARG
jgi:hypothetical protein